MADNIDHLRAAIAAYRGPVTVCPERTFAVDANSPENWNLSVRRSRGRGMFNRAAAQRDKMMQNMAATKALLAEGKGMADVMAKLKISETTYRKYLRELRYEMP